MHSFVGVWSGDCGEVQLLEMAGLWTVYRMFHFTDDEQTKPCGALPTVLKNGGTEKL